MGKFLEDTKFYVNIYTGSVDSGASWEADFEASEKDEGIFNEKDQWDEWGGKSLIEVVKNEAGEWVEA